MAGKAAQGDAAAIDYVVRLGASTNPDSRKSQIDALMQWLVLSAVSGDTKQVFLGGGRCAKCATRHSFTMVKTEDNVPCTKCKAPIQSDWWKLPPLAIDARISKEQAADFLSRMR